MDATCIPTKRKKKVSESNLEARNELYKSKLRSQSRAAIYKSSVYSLTQEMGATSWKTEESISLITPPIPSKRKRKLVKQSTIDPEIANDSRKLNVSLPSSITNIVYESPTNIQALESKVIKRNVKKSGSVTVEKTPISFQDDLPSSSTDFLAKHSNLDDLLRTGSFIRLPAKKRESNPYLNALLDAPTSPNLKLGISKDSQSVLNESAESVSSISAPKSLKTAAHPTTLTVSNLFNPRSDSGKHKEKSPTSNVLSEALPDLLEKGPESAVHPFKIADEASDLEPMPKSQNSANYYESRVKVKKTQDSSSVFPEDIQSTLNLTVTGFDTQNFKSQSNSRVLNPLPTTASSVFDSGIETRKLKKSTLSGHVILNPHLTSSCHLPLQSNSPEISEPPLVWKFDKCDRNDSIDQNVPDSYVGTCAPSRESRSRSKESPIPSREMHRNSVSDEILIVKISPEVQAQRDHFNSPVRPQPERLTESGRLAETKRGINQTSHVAQSLFRKPLPRLVSDMTSASRNIFEFRRQLPQSNIGITEISPSNKETQSKHKPEVQMQHNNNMPLLKRCHERSISSEVSINLPMVGRDMSPPHIDVFEGEASTPRHQPLITEGSSFYQSDFHMSKNQFVVRECDVESVCVGRDVSRHQPLAIDYSTSGGDPCFSSAAPHSETPREGTSVKNEPFIPPRADTFPEYASEAQVLLRSVLREILLFNGESDQWGELAALFNRVSKSGFERDRMNLYTKLIWYLAQRGYGLWHQNLFNSCTMTIVIYTLEACEILTTAVVTFIGLTLTARSDWDFDRLFLHYWSFRGLYDTFSQNWENSSLECVENEASRNHLKHLKKIIQRLLLVTETAFRLLLMYIGENFEERKIEEIERNLSKEDRKYLRRKS